MISQVELNKIYTLGDKQVVLILNHELPEGVVVVDKDLLCSAVEFNSLKKFNGSYDLQEIVNDFIRVGDADIDNRRELRKCFVFKSDWEIDYVKRNYTIYTDSGYAWVSYLSVFKTNLTWMDENLKNMSNPNTRMLIIQSLYNSIKEWEYTRLENIKKYNLDIPDYIEVYNYKLKKEEN